MESNKELKKEIELLKKEKTILLSMARFTCADCITFRKLYWEDRSDSGYGTCKDSTNKKKIIKGCNPWNHCQNFQLSEIQNNKN